MPEAVKEGGGTADVATPEEKVPPSVDLSTDGAVEVKPPPTTEPSLPVDDVKQQQPQQEKEGGAMEGSGGGGADGVSEVQELGEVAPEVKEPPTEEGSADTTAPRNEPASEVEAAMQQRTPSEELKEMILTGSGLLKFKRDCYAAAEVLSKACEKASEIHGELSDDCVELYYLYGWAMLECGKCENNILGENLKDKDADVDDGADNDDDDGVEEGVADAADDDKSEDKEESKADDEAMEVDDSDAGGGEISSEVAAAEPESSNGADDAKGESTAEGDDDDSSLKVAWEMLEMAKIVYGKLDNKEKLAETLMKLGEVGIESGHPNAMDDMIKALEIRRILFPNERIISETHFNIGLGYSMFEMFTEAIIHFEKSKLLLEEMALNLEKKTDEESLKEAKEIREILPDLQEKIQDMIESKQEKRKEVEEVLKNGLPKSMSPLKENGASSSNLENDRPASNISHLIKRKRKIDEVASDLPGKALEESRRKVKALEKDVAENDDNVEGKLIVETTKDIVVEVNESTSKQEEVMEVEEQKPVSETVASEIVKPEVKLESMDAEVQREQSVPEITESKEKSEEAMECNAVQEEQENASDVVKDRNVETDKSNVKDNLIKDLKEINDKDIISSSTKIEIDQKLIEEKMDSNESVEEKLIAKDNNDDDDEEKKSELKKLETISSSDDVDKKANEILSSEIENNKKTETIIKEENVVEEISKDNNIIIESNEEIINKDDDEEEKKIKTDEELIITDNKSIDIEIEKENIIDEEKIQKKLVESSSSSSSSSSEKDEEKNALNKKLEVNIDENVKEIVGVSVTKQTIDKTDDEEIEIGEEAKEIVDEKLSPKILITEHFDSINNKDNSENLIKTKNDDDDDANITEKVDDKKHNNVTNGCDDDDDAGKLIENDDEKSQPESIVKELAKDEDGNVKETTAAAAAAATN